MVYHFMSDDDVDRIMRHPQVAFASDSGVLTFGDGVPHPRGYGNNARVLGTYVRGRARDLARGSDPQDDVAAGGALQVRRTAATIKAGYAADLVVFDPATVADTATFETPHGYADGHPLRARQRRGSSSRTGRRRTRVPARSSRTR